MMDHRPVWQRSGADDLFICGPVHRGRKPGPVGADASNVLLGIWDWKKRAGIVRDLFHDRTNWFQEFTRGNTLAIQQSRFETMKEIVQTKFKSLDLG